MEKINHELIIKKGDYQEISIKGHNPESLLVIYKFMIRLRMLQEEIFKEYHPSDEMRCPVHFVIGQEAVPAALSTLIKKNDFLFGSHRSHGYYFAKGAPMNALVSELYGKKTGSNGGKAGSQEISYSSLNFYSGAILSGGIAMGTGVALGFKIKNQNNVSAIGFGDAATEEGIFWEAVSYAKLSNLPVVFICENNRYSTYSPQLKRQPADNIHDRVASFGVKTFALFGNDVVRVKSVLADAFKHARSGEGPVFVEAYTYRRFAHVGPEDDDYIGYRPDEERAFWQKNCPIKLFEEELVKCEILNYSLKQKILIEIEKEIEAAFDYAKKSPFPDDTDWESQNYEEKTPFADKLLKDGKKLSRFDQYQEDTRLEPY